MHTSVHHVDKGKSAFLGLRKAFVSLDQCILLSHHSDLGMSIAVLRLFQDYQSGRVHCVKCRQQFSLWATMKDDIPQGSALGSLLHMNTLSSKCDGALLLQYTDDIILVCYGPDATAAVGMMNHQLALINGWLVKYRMKLNVQKSHVT